MKQLLRSTVPNGPQKFNHVWRPFMSTYQNKLDRNPSQASSATSTIVRICHRINDGEALEFSDTGIIVRYCR